MEYIRTVAATSLAHIGIVSTCILACFCGSITLQTGLPIEPRLRDATLSNAATSGVTPSWRATLDARVAAIEVPSISARELAIDSGANGAIRFVACMQSMAEAATYSERWYWAESALRLSKLKFDRGLNIEAHEGPLPPHGLLSATRNATIHLHERSARDLQQMWRRVVSGGATREALIEAMLLGTRSEATEVRALAAEGLIMCEGWQVESQVLDRLSSDSEPEVRFAAMRVAIAHLAARHAAPYVEARVAEGSEMARRTIGVLAIRPVSSVGIDEQMSMLIASASLESAVRAYWVFRSIATTDCACVVAGSALIDRIDLAMLSGVESERERLELVGLKETTLIAMSACAPTNGD